MRRLSRRLLVLVSSLGMLAGLIIGGASPAAAVDPVPGSPDTAFNEAVAAIGNGGLNNTGNSVAVDSKGRIVVTGAFANAGGTTDVNGLARFNSDGTPDTVFNTAVNGSGGLSLPGIGFSVAVHGQDGIVVTGAFANAGGTALKGLARFNADGSPDGDFNSKIATSGGLNATGTSVAVDSEGRIVVTGQFRHAGGTTYVNRLARFNADGSPDDDFNEKVAESGGLGTTLTDAGYSVTVASDGKIVVTGQFEDAGGTTGVNRLARFNADGSADTAFNEAVAAIGNGGLSSTGYSVAVASDGKVVVTGNFTDAGGTEGVNRLARFNSDGSADIAFNGKVAKSTGFSSAGYSVVLDREGKIVVTGNFVNAGGTEGVNRLARFNSDGSADTAFNEAVATSEGLTDTGRSVTVDDAGRIVVTGNFVNAGGAEDVNRLARFNGTKPSPPPGPAGPTAKPAKVKKLRVSGSAFSKKKKVSWAKGPTTGRRAVAYYRIKLNVDRCRTVVLNKKLSKTRTSYTFKRSWLLKRKNSTCSRSTRGEVRSNRVKYRVRVQAVNSRGTSTSVRHFVIKRRR